MKKKIIKKTVKAKKPVKKAVKAKKAVVKKTVKAKKPVKKAVKAKKAIVKKAVKAKKPVKKAVKAKKAIVKKAVKAKKPVQKAAPKKEAGLNIILMGPPAAGKGTQSELIVKEYQIPHISTGDMFRAAIANKTKLGLEANSYITAGKLVPDSVTIGLVQERLAQPDCQRGFLLDGFPRTIPQADALEKMLSESGRKLSSVVILVADDAELIDRISNRRVCPKCGASYNLKTKKPLKDGICDSCGSELIQRKDDCAESFKVRLEDYKAKTLPLVDYYKGKGLLKEVNALQDINVVFTDVKKILDEAKA